MKTIQIALVCQNVLSMYNPKNVKLYDRAVSWQVATPGLRNPEINNKEDMEREQHIYILMLCALIFT